MKTPYPIAGVMFPALALPSYMATQVDILESDRVAVRVTKPLRRPNVTLAMFESAGGSGNRMEAP